MLARTADSLSSDDEYESVRSTSVNSSKPDATDSGRGARERLEAGKETRGGARIRAARGLRADLDLRRVIGTMKR